MQGAYSEPARTTQLPVERGSWQQLSEQTAKKRILDGGSLLVVGAPGIGKTFWVRELVAELRDKGLKVDIVSKTHSAVQNFWEGAITADPWVRRQVRNGAPKCDVLVVDEITQIDVQLWVDISRCILKGMSFVLSGDFKQFQAISEHWCACPVPEGSLEHSDMLFELAGGCYLELTKNMRSDQTLLDFYTGIWGMNLGDAIAKGRRDDAATAKHPNFTMVVSHNKRKKINRERNLQDKPSEAVFVRAPKITCQGNAPQNMWVWAGLRMLGAGGKCLKGVFYEIESYENEIVTLVSGEKMSHDECVKCLRLSYAITYASSQGLTLNGLVRLEDTTNRNFGLRHLYVGASRCTSSDFLEVT